MECGVQILLRTNVSLDFSVVWRTRRTQLLNKYVVFERIITIIEKENQAKSVYVNMDSVIFAIW